MCAEGGFRPVPRTYSILHCGDLQLDPPASLEASIIRLPSRSLGGGWWLRHSFVPSSFVFLHSKRVFREQARDFEAG